MSEDIYLKKYRENCVIEFEKNKKVKLISKILI